MPHAAIKSKQLPARESSLMTQCTILFTAESDDSPQRGLGCLLSTNEIAPFAGRLISDRPIEDLEKEPVLAVVALPSLLYI